MITGAAPPADSRQQLSRGRGRQGNIRVVRDCFARLAKAGERIVLFGEGEERRDHIAVEDVAELAARVIERGSTGALNAATGRVAAFRDIATRIAAMAPSKVEIVGSPRQGPMPHGGYRSFDPAAVARAFPDFRFRAWEDGVAALVLPEAAR